MLKRWDTRIYDTRRIIALYDSLAIDLESLNIATPKVHTLDVIIKALLIKEFEGLSLRSAEIRSQELLGVRIDHSVLHFWEKELSNVIEMIVEKVLENLISIDYSISFVDSTIFTNKKEKAQEYKQ